jgi:integrase/recombinase XerD
VLKQIGDRVGVSAGRGDRRAVGELGSVGGGRAAGEGLGDRFVVRRVVMPVTSTVSWTVVGPDHLPVGPVERYLAWLVDIERSPNTVRAYAHDLKLYWSFLAAKRLRWDEPSVESLGEFTAWMRSPAENVVVLVNGDPRRGRRTVNRALTAVVGLYEYEQRNGQRFATSLVDYTRSGRGSYRPFLHGIAKSMPRGRVGRMREGRSTPRTLTLAQVAAIIGVQERLRDRFFFALLALTGMRVGQALGLRHSDFVGHERRIEIVARENANGARAKSEGSIPITGELVRCYSDYMHEEYGDLDSDYVFVNLWAGRIGQPMSSNAVADLVRRTRAKVGFHFTPHMLRHTYATLALRGKVPVEVISRLVTHRSVETTSSTYLHPSVEDLREALAAAGMLDQLGELL